MSSAAIPFLSSSATVQARYSASSRNKDFRYVPSAGIIPFQCSSSKQGTSRAEKNNVIFVGSNQSRLIAAKAGLGRISGAVHGNSHRKYRRRRLPQQQDLDQENGDGGENSQQSHGQTAAGFEVVVADVVHGNGSPTGSPNLSHKKHLDDTEVGQRMHDEGESFSVASGSLACNGEVTIDDGSDQELSHKRYLQEIGACMRIDDVSENSPIGSGHLQVNPEGIYDDSSVDGMHDDGESISGVRDLERKGDGIFHEETVNGVHDVVQTDLGYQGLKKPSSQSSQQRRVGKPDVIADAAQGGSLDEMGHLAAPLIANSGRYQNLYLVDTIESGLSGNGVQGSKSNGRSEAFPDPQISEVARSGFHDEKVLRSPSASAVGIPRKQHLKKRKKKLVGSFSKKLASEVDNERVREVPGGAEQLVDPPVLTGHQSESRSEKGLAVSLSVEAFMFNETTAGFKRTGVEYEESEGAIEIETVVKSPRAVDQPEYSLEVSAMEHNIAQEVMSSKLSNFIKGTRDEDNCLNANQQGRPFMVVNEAGVTVVPCPQGAAPEQEELVGQNAESGTRVPAVVEQALLVASKVVPVVVVEQAAQVASKVAELPVVVVEQAAQVGGQVVEQVVEILPDAVTGQVSQVVDKAVELQTQVVEQVTSVTEQVVHLGQKIVVQVSEAGDSVVGQVSEVAEQVASTVTEQVQQVTESVSITAAQVADQVTSTVENVTSTASQVVEQVTDFFADDDIEGDSDDEFEAYKTSDLPEFRGKRGLDNFIVKQEGQGVLSRIYDFYTFMLKQPLPEFTAAMFSAPIILSLIFTLLYLPQFEGLAFDEAARDFVVAAGGDALTLHLSWYTLFQVFMFSLSLSTGLQPELAPLSPYTLVVANINALVAQLVFVFLSGAVFARLSQPSQPVRFSTVALMCTTPAQRRRKENAVKVLMARYVLAGPQPCELVDVKVDLTYKYNTLTRTGSYFRATQPLKLVRPEIAFLTHGMLVRHVIDETSPLYQRTPEMLKKEDAVFCLSVGGLERASMQSVFHVQHYCVVDDDIIWNAEFEDLILINKKNKRVVDHSRLSMWKHSPEYYI